MLDHLWSIVCQSSSIDIETNRLSIFNVIENLSINSQEGQRILVPLQFDIVSSWLRKDISEPVYATMRITYSSPEGENILQQELVFEITKAPLHRTRIHFPNIPVTTSGCYKFMVDLKMNAENVWCTVATIPLFIKILEIKIDTNLTQTK
jgi:hypothetical protein